MVNCNVVLFNFFPLIEAVQSWKQSAMGLDDEQSIQTQPYRRIVGESRELSVGLYVSLPL